MAVLIAAKPNYAVYMSDAQNNIAEGSGSTGVTPYDSGNITGNPVPGGAALKNCDGTIQQASALASGQSIQTSAGAGSVNSADNFTPSTSGNGVGIPTLPSTATAAGGLSGLPSRE